MDVLELPARAVEGGRGEREVRLEHLSDRRAVVDVARVRDRELLQELGGVALVVARVDADERHLAAELLRRVLEVGEFAAARPAPRRPLVDDDRMTAQRREPRLERGGAARQERARLLLERGDRRRRTRSGARRAGARAARALR